MTLEWEILEDDKDMKIKNLEKVIKVLKDENKMLKSIKIVGPEKKRMEKKYLSPIPEEDIKEEENSCSINRFLLNNCFGIYEEDE